MLSEVVSKQSGTLASIAFADAYTDFVLSRQAMQCTKATLEFYRYTAAKFLAWAEGKGANKPEQIDAYLVRQYLAGLAEQGKADTTLHDNARAIRTLLRFWPTEGYMDAVKFEMPRVAKKRLPVLSTEELKRAREVCQTKRDKAKRTGLPLSLPRQDAPCCSIAEPSRPKNLHSYRVQGSD